MRVMRSQVWIGFDPEVDGPDNELLVLTTGEAIEMMSLARGKHDEGTAFEWLDEAEEDMVRRGTARCFATGDATPGTTPDLSRPDGTGELYVLYPDGRLMAWYMDEGYWGVCVERQDWSDERQRHDELVEDRRR